jgi:hypothetical protein
MSSASPARPGLRLFDPNAPDNDDARRLEAEILRRLDVPDCDCPLFLTCPCRQDCPPGIRDQCRHCREECDCPPALHQPACAHVLSADHALSLDDWEQLLLLAYPGPDGPPPPPSAPTAERRAWHRQRDNGYGEPHAPLLAEEVDGPDAMVDLFVLRHDHGVGLRHPEDLRRDNELQAGPRVSRFRNGEDDVGPIEPERRAA